MPSFRTPPSAWGFPPASPAAAYRSRSSTVPGWLASAVSTEVSSTAFGTQPPEFTTSALDGLPARPAPCASKPVLVHRLVRLLHASFGHRLATTPLRFAMTSPPAVCQGDFHPQAVKHARHTANPDSVRRLSGPEPRTAEVVQETVDRRAVACRNAAMRASCARRSEGMLSGIRRISLITCKPGVYLANRE
jgi:hypothetical protein